MGKGIKFLLVFCLICMFFNMMAKSDVNMAGALVETGHNLKSAVQESLKEVDWDGLYQEVKGGFEIIVDNVKSNL